MGDSGGRKGQLMGDLGGETRRNQRSLAHNVSMYPKLRAHRAESQVLGSARASLGQARADNPEEYTLGVDKSMRAGTCEHANIVSKLRPHCDLPPDIRRTRKM